MPVLRDQGKINGTPKTPPAKIRRRFWEYKEEREVEIRDPLSWVSSSPEVATVTVDPENCNHATITATMEEKGPGGAAKTGGFPWGEVIPIGSKRIGPTPLRMCW